MNDEMRDPDLERRVQQVADEFEASAAPEARVVARLERRLQRGRAVRVMATAAAAVALTIGGLGIRATLTGPPAGEATMPEVVGVFVSGAPDDDGRCFGLRLYETTSTDSRVALWSWAGQDGCAGRLDRLASGVGWADAVQLSADTRRPARVGIAVRADLASPAELTGFAVVLDQVTDGQPDRLVAYPSASDAASDSAGVTWHRVERLDIPYRPD